MGQNYRMPMPNIKNLLSLVKVFENVILLI